LSQRGVVSMISQFFIVAFHKVMYSRSLGRWSTWMLYTW